MDEILLTKREVAERLHTSLWSVERMVGNGLLPVVPVGKRVRVRPADLDQYIKSNVNYKGRVTRTTEAIQKSILVKGAAREKDLLDAIHAAPEMILKADKRAAKAKLRIAKKAKKKRKKQARLQQAATQLPTGSLPSSAVAKGVFGAQLTKDGRSTFAADSPFDMRAELERQLTERDPALRLFAEKALTPKPPERAVDDPAYWRGLAESPLSTAAERTRYLATAKQLENDRRPRFSSSYAQ